MSSSLNFEIDKCSIITKLEEYSRKMKLTNNYINSFNYINDFNAFAYNCNSYNHLITECSSLKNRMLKLKKWGCIFNSKMCWFHTLDTIETGFKLYSENIIKIFVCNFKCKKSRIFDEDYVNHQIRMYDKLKMYLKTYKINGNYIYIQDNVYISIGSCCPL